ncbi:UDP-N-acetylenolpyruvoylglucosamine reductase [Candidatus Daviesbacteria bacterium RIFCSPLOWO2_01_FULL_40_27]|nr:MAG: UDP-N-acetylenolpyruvoylglucosamine reductase [Candidatus Daviesbacteria bacterium RIFCSPLOWO2_01_FULL_40_27]
MLQLEDNYPMNQITTLGIGGLAKKFVVVTTFEELIEAVEYAQGQRLPYLVIGGGSNLLISDEGVDCLVIKNEMTAVVQNDTEITVKSGTPLQELVDYTISHGLADLQKLTGIPGTVGGAVYGNAGAYGQTISDHLTAVSVLNTNNLTTEQLNNSDCLFNYRDSIFKKTHDTIVEVHFQLERGDPHILQQEARDVLSKRLVKYPPGIKCPGSFFKNLVASEIPQEILKNIPQEKIVFGKLPAGALLEEVGAKGQKSDGIEIAPYHANLFINQGSGSAKAFYNLAKAYALKVKEKFGITLEPEVQLINLPPLAK